jgi:Leucine-rich repeat (LRR) protein
LDGLEGMPNLSTLDVSHNMIADINNCAAIKQCPKLVSFDVRDNQMASGDDF